MRVANFGLRFLLLAPLGLLLACDPISEDQCRAGDWQLLGFEDGKRGLSASRLDEYAQICGEFGIAPARDTYLAARQQGLQFYCTPDNAYRVGREGDRLANVCSRDQLAAMLPAYNRGQDYYEISKDINEIEDEIDDLRAQIAAFPDPPDADQQAQINTLKSRIRRLDGRVFHLELEQRRYARWP